MIAAVTAEKAEQKAALAAKKHRRRRPLPQHSACTEAATPRVRMIMPAMGGHGFWHGKGGIFLQESLSMNAILETIDSESFYILNNHSIMHNTTRYYELPPNSFFTFIIFNTARYYIILHNDIILFQNYIVCSNTTKHEIMN